MKEEMKRERSASRRYGRKYTEPLIVEIGPELKRDLRKLSRKTGWSMSRLARSAIETLAEAAS